MICGHCQTETVAESSHPDHGGIQYIWVCTTCTAEQANLWLPNSVIAYRNTSSIVPGLLRGVADAIDDQTDGALADYLATATDVYGSELGDALSSLLDAVITAEKTIPAAGRRSHQGAAIPPMPGDVT